MLYRIVNHWIDFGVDGFRFDVINLFLKVNLRTLTNR
ncbi:alpha-amylase family glycosyl hydrolase [Staphylococcus aureus]